MNETNNPSSETTFSEEVKETPEEKAKRVLFDKLSNAFTSGVFDRKHGFVYLDRSKPTEMLCATYSPDEMYARSRNAMDAVRRVFTKGIDLFPFWESKLPLAEFDRFCISYGGIQSMKKRCKDDFQSMKKLWLIHPITGMRYIEKSVKKGTREEIEIKPIVWPLSSAYFTDLEEDINHVVQWVDSREVKDQLVLEKEQLERSEITLLNLSQLKIGRGVRLPYSNGLCGTSLCGYKNISALKNVVLHLGRDGNIFRYYVISDDNLATVYSTMPACVYYVR